MTTPPGGHLAPSRTLDAEVAAGALQLAFARLPASIALAVIIGFGFVALLFPFFPARDLGIWIAVMGVAYLARFVGWWWWRRSLRARDNVAQWQIVFAIGACLAGGSWAFGGVTLLPSPGHLETMLLIVSVLVVSSTAANTLGAQYVAMVLFLGTSILPVATALALRPGTVEQMTALALACWFLGMAIAGRQTNATTLRLIRTEIEHAHALADAASSRALAEASSDAKSRFLANMSHEVRTPLNGVLGLAQLLARSRLDARQAEQVRLLQQSGQHLLHIVNEILDFSKIEAGRLELVLADFELHALVAECHDLTVPAAQAAGLELTVTVDPNLPPRLTGDVTRLKQVLLNLLGNAVKFTPAGAVTLRVSPAATTSTRPSADASAPTVVTFAVEDTGIGIAEADIERVFDAFTQADDRADRRFGGTGLGLTVSRELATLMGGGVQVHARPGGGSIFLLTLPFAAAKTAAANAPTDVPSRAIVVNSAQAAAAGAPGPTAPRVLLAEDNPVNREVLIAMLAELDIDVVCVANGHEAVLAVQGNAFDAVLMDCQMPVLDGYAATAAIRAAGHLDRWGRPLPIIALTANAFSEDRERAMAAGMDDFVAKPVPLDILDATIQRWLGNPAAGTAARNASASSVVAG